MKRAKRTRRAKHTRTRLHLAAERLAKDVYDLAYAVLKLDCDHLDRYEREGLTQARTLLHDAGRVLESVASSFRRKP